MPQRLDMTPAEWHVMECLWEQAPRTGREATEYLSQHAGWSRSTTLTMLRRMNEKGYVSCEERDGMKSYAPLIPREKAVLKETENFISRVYHGSVGMMMNAIARQKKLTQAEIEELYAILDEAKGETK